MDGDGGTRVFTLVARPPSAGEARAATRDWLESVGCPQPLGDDIVYAVNEAVSNAIEHAYPAATEPGTVQLALRIDLAAGYRRVRAEIRDHGRWRDPPPDDEGRRRGIRLMEALMDELTIRQAGAEGDVGTSVVMLSPAITPDPGQPVDPPAL